MTGLLRFCRPRRAFLSLFFALLILWEKSLIFSFGVTVFQIFVDRDTKFSAGASLIKSVDFLSEIVNCSNIAIGSRSFKILNSSM